MSVRLVDNTQKVIEGLRQACADGINNALAFGTDEARDLAPVDTGFLKEHIGMTKAASVADLTGEMRSLAPYSGFVNYGTRKMAAQPFWTVAMLMMRNQFNYLFKSGFIRLERGQSAGPGVIRAALMDYHGPLGRKGGGI